MREVPLTSARFQVSEEPERCTFLVPIPREWVGIVFLSFWLVGWAAGELRTWNQLTTGRIDWLEMFGACWWTLGGIFCIYSLSQMLVGRQRLTLQGGILEVSNEFAGMARGRRYDISRIVSLRTYNPDLDEPSLRMRGLAQPAVKFSYGTKIVGIAPGLPEPEARLLIERLRAHGVDPRI